MHDVEVSKTQSTCHTFVFSEAIMVAPFPNNFKMLSITPYNGKGDLATHVEVFRL